MLFQTKPYGQSISNKLVRKILFRKSFLSFLGIRNSLSKNIGTRTRMIVQEKKPKELLEDRIFTV
ncbi:CDP-diacylglycerol--glycerol-3-phosphate 3-phosphatidyltransferase, partial [Leptospira ellisii]